MSKMRQQGGILSRLAQLHYSLLTASYVNRVQGLPKASTCHASQTSFATLARITYDEHNI